MLRPFTHSDKTVTIRPIETRYAGHRFRSRLEARWAVLLDRLNIRWLYEHQGFETPLGPYLPDFWLPELNTFLEVKPGIWSSDEAYKLEQLIRAQKAYGAFGLPFDSDQIVSSLYPVDENFERLHPWPAALPRPASWDSFPLPKAASIGWDNICCPACGEDNVHFKPPQYLTGDYPHRHVRDRGPITAIPMWSENCDHQWELVIAFHKGSTSMQFCLPHDRNTSPLELALEGPGGAAAVAAARTARFEHGETP
jgi:hypothetical protein